MPRRKARLRVDLAAVWRLCGRTEVKKKRKKRITTRVGFSTLNNAVGPPRKLLNPHVHQCVKYINHSLCFLAAGGVQEVCPPSVTSWC